MVGTGSGAETLPSSAGRVRPPTSSAPAVAAKARAPSVKRPEAMTKSHAIRLLTHELGGLQSEQRSLQPICMFRDGFQQRVICRDRAGVLILKVPERQCSSEGKQFRST